MKARRIGKRFLLYIDEELISAIDGTEGKHKHTPTTYGAGELFSHAHAFLLPQ